MNDMSLSRLYRRLVAGRPQPDMDAADLVAVVSGNADADNLSARHRDAVVAKLSVSARHAGLARMLHALRPASAALAQDINAHRRVAHPARRREMHVAAGTRHVHVRRMRWAGGVAACLAVVLGMWSWQHQGTQRDEIASVAPTAPLQDRIFTSRDRIFASSGDAEHRGQARAGHHDEVFHGSFAAGG